MMYAMYHTIPDFAYVISMLSNKYTSNPRKEHWNALVILRYSKGSLSYWLHFSWYPAIIEGYSAAIWNSAREESIHYCLDLFIGWSYNFLKIEITKMYYPLN